MCITTKQQSNIPSNYLMQAIYILDTTKNRMKLINKQVKMYCDSPYQYEDYWMVLSTMQDNVVQRQLGKIVLTMLVNCIGENAGQLYW